MGILDNYRRQPGVGSPSLNTSVPSQQRSFSSIDDVIAAENGGAVDPSLANFSREDLIKYVLRTGNFDRVPKDVVDAAKEQMLEEFDKELGPSEQQHFEVAVRSTWRELLRDPLPGSIVRFFADRKKRSNKGMVTLLSEVLLRDLTSVFVNSDVDLSIYMVYRMVCSHKTAMTMSEYWGKALREQGTDINDSNTKNRLLSHLLDKKIESRADLKQIFYIIHSYHNELGAWLLDYFKLSERK